MGLEYLKPHESPDEAFKREVRAELKHLREMMSHINATLDVLLEIAKQDEKHHEAAHG